MARRKKVYEGKAKILYEGPEPGTLIQYFKDDGSKDDATIVTPGVVEGRGVLNNRLSEFFMTGLNSIGVPTHFIRRLNMREQLVRMAEIVPLEVVVRNYSAGELSSRLGIPEGTALPRPIVEYYYKDEKLGNPLVSEEHILAFGWAGQQDLDDIVALALRVNDFLSGVMMGVGVRLMDFSIEVGRIWEGDFMRLIVADEISPDSCRLWDTRGPDASGQEGAAREPSPLADVYTELARRLGVLPSNVTHFAQTYAHQLKGLREMKARVHVMLKDGVLDPQGEAVRHALGTLGFDGVQAVRQGKVIELDLTATDRTAAEAEVKAMCEKLLANTVIEKYTVEIA